MNKLESIKNEVKKLMDKNDTAHDFGHIMRVYNNAKMICKKENVDSKLVLYAVLLHDVVSFAKNTKNSKYASEKSANLAKKILKKHGFTNKEIKTICDAILDHSFSKNRKPKTIEGRILQDADRLDAIGAIGIARAFAVSGAEKRPFYSNNDPFCNKRMPDDKEWTLDHFYKKLLRLEKMMNTKSAKLEAKKRTKVTRNFLREIKKEIYP